jgi:ABC-2 type transport system ATP-binding protein
MIKLANISKKYDAGIGGKNVLALDSLDLEIHQGEVFGFLGPNGAGKSTAIKILMNLIFSDTGTAEIGGKDVRNSDARKVVGFLPENPYFYDYLTADELMWFGGKTAGMNLQSIRKRSDFLMTKVDLQNARKRPLRTYSKGMMQRAGLAFALIHDPDVVILDEPMSGLDPIGRKMVGDLLIELKQQGKTVFFSSHILNDIERFSDRAGIIIGGRLRLVDTISKLLSINNHLEDVFMKEVEAAEGGSAT